MKSVARDSIGVLSSKNTTSKYWGVSKVKNKEAFTVRFYDKVNQEIITFKPLSALSEELCARIAARFCDEPNLYATSSEIIVMQFGGKTALVNTCNNTIKVNDYPKLTEVTKLPEGTRLGQSLDVMKAAAGVGESIVYSTAEAKKPKKEKVVDHFRNRVNEIILEALTSAKAKLAARNAVVDNPIALAA